MTTPHTIIAIIYALFSASGWAEVKELNNTEMTEAYIKDGSIIIKQRAVTPTPKKTLKYKVGPGEPITTEAETVSDISQQNSSQQTLLNEALNRDLSNKQLQNNQLNQSLVGVSIPETLSPAQQIQQQYAQDIVRTGLGLPDGSNITPAMMGQYLSQTFTSPNTNALLGTEQTITTNGFQISIPNPGGLYGVGVYPSGDNSMNVETTNQHLIFNLIFPKE